MPEARPPNPPYPTGALPIGTRVGEFEVRRVLGVGGFGIVYLAFDHLLEREVALKEYMPSSLVERNETLHVSLISQEHADTFALGLRSFVNEARLLARFDHPSLVKVHRFWEANGTAYMAMALYRGRTVRDVRLEMKSRPDEAWVRNILEPLLGAIDKLHGEDVYHRDIAPDNILIEADGRPVLLDFGAARRVISDRSQALTAILKPSYAPIEQYADVSGMKQGPWTDIYALGATVHFLLLGKPPPPAPGRSIQDTMPALASQDLPGCSRPFLELVDWMLTPLPTERPQNVATVRDALAGRIKPPSKQPPSPVERTMPMTGPGGRDEATVVVPRGQTQLPVGPGPGDEATVIVPRPGQTGLTPPTRSAPPMAPPPRNPAVDEDATVVTPYTGYQTQRPSAPTRTHQAPPEPPPPPVRTQQAPPAGRAPAPTIFPPPTAAPPTSAGGSRAWLVPVVAGAAVALGVGGGLWWFLTRPAVPTMPSTPPPASAPAQATTGTQTPTPAANPTPGPGPQASATQVSPAAPAPSAAAPDPLPSGGPAAAAGKGTAATPAPATGRAGTPPPAKPQPRQPDAPVQRTQEAPAAPPARTQPQAAPSAPAAGPPLAATGAAAAPSAPPPDDGRPKSPSERCAKELPLVRLVCIDLACNRAEFSKHPECIKLRAEQQSTRRLGEGNN